MPENVVSMVRYQGLESIKSLIDLCGGLEGIKPGAKVLVKPNLVGWDNQGPYPPWGVLTTSIVLEGLCAALKDAGAGEIRIGEGSIKCKHIGSGTKEIYDNLGFVWSISTKKNSTKWRSTRGTRSRSPATCRSVTPSSRFRCSRPTAARS